MATPTDKLVIEIRAETRALRKSMSDVQKQLRRTDTQAKRTGAGLAAAFSKARIALLGLGVAVGAAGRGVIGVTAQFETLKLSLDVVFGSAEKGAQAFERILDFAQTTPFQIETVTRAFISLKSAGIEPNAEQLQIFADTASVAIDKVGTFEALIRTVQRAASGGMQLEELNMLDDRGIPAIKILMERLGKSKSELSAFGTTAEGAAIMVRELTQGLKEMFPDAMEAQMMSVETLTSNLSIAFKGLQEEIGLLVAPTYKDVLSSLTDVFNSAADFVERRRKAIEDIALNSFRQQAPDLAAFHVPSGAGVVDDEDTKKIVQASDKEIGFLNEFQKLVKETVPEATRIRDQIDLINDAVKRGVTDTDGNPFFDPEEAEKVVTMLESELKAMEDVSNISNVLAQSISDSAQSFSKEFTDALLDGKNALESFNNLAKNIVSQIISTFIQLGVVNKILNQVFGAGTFDELGADGKIVKADTREDASGGAAFRGQPTLVGERGPEIFVPHTAGTIMNNMNTKNAMGGTPIVVNQSVNFATGVVPTVRAEVTKMLPDISDVTKGAVLEAAMRGGQYRKGLLGG